MKLVFSFDDYNSENIKLANLIKKYGFEKQTVFFIECNGSNAQDQIKQLFNMGFIIGSHTLSHPFLTRIPLEAVEEQIAGSKLIIEYITNKKCEWFAYPRGYYNKDIINLLKKYNYKYARTTLLETKSNYEIGGVQLTYPKKEYDGKDPFEVAKISELNHYWGHTKEIITFSLWKKLEKFLKWAKEQK